jgi:predicted DNA-binding transcriptional regulator AlpA
MSNHTPGLLWNSHRTQQELDCSRTTLWRRWTENPTFPQPIIFDSGRLYWWPEEVIAWRNQLPKATPEQKAALRQRMPGYRKGKPKRHDDNWNDVQAMIYDLQAKTIGRLEAVAKKARVTLATARRLRARLPE